MLQIGMFCMTHCFRQLTWDAITFSDKSYIGFMKKYLNFNLKLQRKKIVSCHITMQVDIKSGMQFVQQERQKSELGRWRTRKLSQHFFYRRSLATGRTCRKFQIYIHISQILNIWITRIISQTYCTAGQCSLIKSPWNLAHVLLHPFIFIACGYIFLFSGKNGLTHIFP